MGTFKRALLPSTNSTPASMGHCAMPSTCVFSPVCRPMSSDHASSRRKVCDSHCPEHGTWL